jgi:hypothetical protein
MKNEKVFPFMNYEFERFKRHWKWIQKGFRRNLLCISDGFKRDLRGIQGGEEKGFFCNPC